MTNNIKQIKKDLCSYAKRFEGVHYTESLLIMFLMTGLLFIRNNLFSDTTDKSIEEQRQTISTSIKTMQQQVKATRKENDKLLKNTTLELIQLMEQGDHVVKSPWSSWQYGINYFNNNWNGTYKGRGDKQEKYPYEGIFERGPWWESHVNPTSPGYGLLGRNRNSRSASTTEREASTNNTYGLITRDEVIEPVVELQLGASVRPKAITRNPVAVSAPAGPTGTGPTLPNVSVPRFNPAAPEPQIPTFAPLSIFNIQLGSYCNSMVACGIRSGGNGGAYDTANQNIANSFTSGGDKVITQGPSLRHAWTNYYGKSFDGALLYSFFDYTSASNATATLKANGGLKITSINPIHGTTEGETEKTTNARPWNNQPFLVGGSRIATVDNVINATLVNEEKITMLGPLVVGFEVQTDTNRGGNQGVRAVINKGTITDAGEDLNTDVQNKFTGNTLDLYLSPNLGGGTGTYGSSGYGKIEVKKGYTGYKVGLILTLEDVDATNNQNYKLINGDNGTGTINFSGEKSIGIQIYAPGSPNTIITAQNAGNITMNGGSSYGMKLSSQVDASKSIFENTSTGTITIGGTGENSSGMAKLSDVSFDSGNLVKNNGTINVSGDKKSGMFLKSNNNDTFTSTNKINITGGTNNAGMRIEANTTPAGIQKGVNTGTIEISGGSNNMGMLSSSSTYTAGSVVTTVENGTAGGVTSGTIKISSGSSNVGLMNNDKGIFTNYGTVDVSGGTKNVGLLISSGSQGFSDTASKVTVGGSENTGVINYGTYDMNGSTIEVSGNNSIGLYSKDSGGTSNTTAKGIITASTGAVAMFAENSTMKLENLTANVNDSSLLFYNYTKNSTPPYYHPTGNFNIGPNVTANINAGGVAFYNVGNIGSISTFLNAWNGTANAMTLNMASGSRLFVLDQPGLVVNLSGVPAQASGGTISLQNGNGQTIANVVGTDYKYYTMNKATLNIDQQVNLDDANDKYHSLEFISSNVNINSPMTNNGNNIARGLQYAVAQGNAGTSVGDLVVTNNSTINLTNQAGVTGIVTDFGTINNLGTVINTGDNGIGLLGANSSVVTNSGTITVGNGGAALYGINALTGGSSGNIDLTNNGTINSTSPNGSYGIVAKNISGTSSVTLTGNSNIDFSANPGGVAVYAENSTINNNGGSIKLSNNGVGIQSKGTSTINLAGGTITGTGNDAMGVYSDTAITNVGTAIDLQGDHSTGIFSAVSVINNNSVKVGNSSSQANPSIAIYAPQVTNNSVVEAGTNSIGIYSTAAGNVDLNSGSTLNVGSGGTGVYKDGGIVNVNNGTALNIAANDGIGVFATNGATINNYQSNINIGNSSIGFAVDGSTFNATAGTSQTLGTDVVYAYARNGGTINNNAVITTSGDSSTALYGAGSIINNNADIDLTGGTGNVGILNVGSGAKGYNTSATIKVGKSDRTTNSYSIGMAATDGAEIYNDGTIIVTGDRGIGMYGTGAGTIVENRLGHDIILDASGASSSSPIKQMIGMFLDNGAKGINHGNIKTAGSYSGNSNVQGLIGVAAMNGSTFENHGNINIDGDSSYGMYIFNSVVKNYGTIVVNGSASRGAYFRNSIGVNGVTLTNDNAATEINGAGGTITATGGAVPYEAITYDPTKISGGISLKKGPDGLVHAYDENGNLLQAEFMNNVPQVPNFAFSNIGVYIDTLGKTTPITGSAFVPTGKMDVIIGAEAAKETNAKVIKVGSNIINPFLSTIPSGGLNFYSGALTWQATYDETDNSVTMAKYSYTKYSNGNTDLYNFTDGLEQRYDMNALDSREKQLFNRLNDIGDNEDILLSQAFDEMMGHQYGNLQQRINATGNLLDKEFRYLKHDWRNPSKQNNKIKVFGMRDEYNTDTAGIIDYTSNAYGVAYVHEDETVRMGNSSGWYAGAVTNRFKFKDIGSSRENQTMLKAGIFKTMSPRGDHNGALQWTIGGDVFVGINDMKRRYLVVDEIFQAKSDYHSYGAALKTDLGYDIRMSERTHLRPYGALKLEYGRFNDIKEDRGEMRLEVDGNDYFSVKPEVGIEFKYVQPLAVRTNLSVGLTAAYENELGKVGDVDNKGRVRYTTADWFGIRGEKDDRKGSGKFDLNIGVDNTRFGVTVNAGYDTKGKNVRTGIGFRAIY